jgi:predicted amidohydrolase YtcJ
MTRGKDDMSVFHRIGLSLAAFVSLLPLQTRSETQAAADVVVMDAKIYTEDAHHRTVQALALRDGRLVYVGTNKGAEKFVGANTKVERLGGKLVLPGLIDAHIHPTGIVKVDSCDLNSQPKTLAEITDLVRTCIQRFQVKDGQWLTVQQWNFATGNQPDASHSTIRAALDLASTAVPIQLFGNDGHHSGFNSAALALAKNSQGQKVGFSGATLKRDFSQWTKLIGVDATGEPNGTVNEDARQAMGAPFGFFAGLAELMKTPEKVPELLNRDGITAVQDAAVSPEMLLFYDALYSQGKLTVHVNLAQLYEPEAFRTADGRIDYAKIVAQAEAVRDKYSKNPLIKANAIKLFADGVLEGNPLAVPPTLPESPSIRPYLQPIFGRDDKGNATLKGYVDTTSQLCQEVRTHSEASTNPEYVKKFMDVHGFHPAQCTTSSGKLQHDRQVIMDYVKAMHVAGFTVHIHAIGDEAVRTALDSFEAARAANGVSTQPDTIAHAQLVSPNDVVRMGKDHIYIAYTYAWFDTEPAYDMSVIPFIDHVKDGSYESLHNPSNYYERQAYPALSTKKAGAILIAGSDAPVDDRDPRPFVNMAQGVTRALPDLPPLGAQERLNIRDVIDAYTVNGARALGRENEIGSLDPGKSADFIVLDQDILDLAEARKADQIRNTKVLETWFMGRKVYAADGAAIGSKVSAMNLP